MKKKFIGFILAVITATSILPTSIANAYVPTSSSQSLVKVQNTYDSLPSKYDSRNLGYISNVKDQGEIGSCWTFSTMGALESAIKKNTGESMDFSEIHLATNNGFFGANDGGNGLIATSYFSSWKGPVYEKDAPYPNPATMDNVKSSYTGTVTNHIQDIIFVDKTKTGQAKIDNVKHNVYKYGSSTVQVSIDAINENGTIFNYSGNEIDHEILIVGWDDNYSKKNFEGYKQPENDGAFICRNSWGESLGLNGYFYLSYEDANLLDPANTLISFDKVESTNNYKDVYDGCFNRDISKPSLSYQDNISEVIPLKMSSSFSEGINDNEEISAIGIPCLTSDVNCDLYYVENEDNNAELNLDDLISPENKIQSFHIKDAGFHTIKLDNPIIPKKKDSFTFLLRIYFPNELNIGRSSKSTNFTKKYYKFLLPKKKLEESTGLKLGKHSVAPTSMMAGRFYTKEISSVKNGWVPINNNWYYYNENGTFKIGWNQIDGSWYYFDNSGIMHTGWLNDNGTWYFLNPSGNMHTGWLNDSGTWYFLNSSGNMHTGWLNDSGTWYFLNSSGNMHTGWLNDNGTWYFLNPSGTIHTGWLNDSGTWYFLNSSGNMHTGWLNDSGTWYFLNSSGTMAKNTIIDGWWLNSDGKGSKI